MIITAIIEAIQACQEQRDRADIEAGLNNPGLLERFALRAILRKKGYRGRKLVQKVREGMEELRSLEPDEVSALMDAAA